MTAAAAPISVVSLPRPACPHLLILAIEYAEQSRRRAAHAMIAAANTAVRSAAHGEEREHATVSITKIVMLSNRPAGQPRLQPADPVHVLLRVEK